jgi:hypothetical protein
MLQSVAPVDDGPVVAMALNSETPDRIAHAAFALIGPRTVGTMMDEFFAMDDEFQRRDRRPSEGEVKRYHRLQDAIVVSRVSSFIPALMERGESGQPSRIRQMAALLTRRGSIDEGEPLILSGETREALTNVVQRWMDLLLASPEANRHQFADAARAAGWLGAQRLVQGLKQMLDRDLTDWARARAEHLSSPRRGPVPPDVSHSYVLQYQRAFAGIDGPEVTAVLYEYLPDPRFGAHAAAALFENWNRRHASGSRPVTPWRDFSGVKTQRRARQDRHNRLPTSDYAERIFAVARELGQPGHEDTIQRHAFALARVGLGLPHGSKRREIDQLLALPQRYAAKLGLLTAAALAGEILPADTLLAGVRELLQTAETERWRLDANHGELNGWLVLFAFADRPIAVLEALDLLPAHHRDPWNLCEMLRVFAQSPDSAGALEAIEELARCDPRITRQYDWCNAIVTLGTESAASALLRFLIDGDLQSSADGVNAWRVIRQLAQLGRTFPTFRESMLQHYNRMSAGHAKVILEGALAELADPEIILCMIQSYASDHRPMDGRLYNAVRDLAVGRRPAEDLPGAYETFGVPLIRLRQRLFELMQGTDARSALAEQSLVAIEEIRDEAGRPDDEPRHPDIESDLPWPRLATE